MADLLECVIQIKALADTPRRLGLRVVEARRRAGIDVGPVLRGLLAHEAWLHDSIAAGLAADDPGVRAEPAFDPASGAAGAPADSPDALMARFASLRAAIVQRLDSLSAAQLSATVRVAGRGRTTIADLVALTLAHDTDSIAWVVGTSC